MKENNFPVCGLIPMIIGFILLMLTFYFSPYDHPYAGYNTPGIELVKKPINTNLLKHLVK